MKKILKVSLVITALCTMFACSSSSGPSDVVEKSAKYMQEENFNAMVDLIYFDEADSEAQQMKEAIKSMMNEKGSKALEEMGGIESYEIISEEISEDGESATVVMNTMYGNGASKKDTTELIKVDGKWYIELNK